MELWQYFVGYCATAFSFGYVSGILVRSAKQFIEKVVN